MKVLGSAVLAMEAIVILLAIPVAIVVGERRAALAGGTGGALALLCFVGLSRMRSPQAVWVGSVVQVVVLASGLVVREFLVPAVVFGACWVIAVIVAEKVAAKKS